MKEFEESGLVKHKESFKEFFVRVFVMSAITIVMLSGWLIFLHNFFNKGESLD